MKKETVFVAKSLRQKAEELLSKKVSVLEAPLVEADSLRLMHEMEVYQIELDMQSDELQKSKDEDAHKMKLFHELEVHKLELEMQKEEINCARLAAEEMAKKYSFLYDFAPTGYFTLSNEGYILDLNFCGAQMLKKEKSKLINSRFNFFVNNNTIPFFQLFLEKIFITNKTENCEISIDGSNTVYLHLTGIADNENQCLVTAVDITNRKLAEEKLFLKNSIFDSSIASNSILDLDGSITEVNNEFYLNWGYKSKYDVIGKPFSDFFQEKSEANEVFDNINKTGQWEGEFIARRVNGSNFVAHAVATLLRDKYGQVIGYQSSILDVSERNRVESALKENEEMLKNVMEHFPGVVFWKDAELNYKGCNKAFATAAGLNSSDLIVGKSDYDLPWDKTEAQSFRNDDIQVLESGVPKLHIIEIQHQAEGKIAWFDTSKVPLYNHEGQITGVLGASNNITENKIADEALKKTQLLLKSSIESPKDMIILSIDKDFNYLFFNNFHKKVMKNSYHQEVSVGMNILDCISLDEDRIISKKNYSKALGGKSHITIEKFGEFVKRYYETRYSPIINEQNEVIGATAFSADITDRINTEIALKENEHKYRELVENSPDAIVIYIDSKIVFGNKQALLMIGATSDKQLIGKSVLEFVHPQSHALVMARMRNPSKEVLPSAEEKFIKIDGTSVDVEVKATNILIDNKDAVQLIVRDITERKVAEEALKESEARFRKLLQDVEFVSIQGYALDGTTLYWNNASELMYGYTAEEAIGKNLLELIIPDEMKVGVKAAIEQMAQTAIPIPASELKLKRKDGSLISVYSYHTIVQVPEKPQELFCFDIDLTQRIVAEEALKESEENYRFMFANNPQPMFIYNLETLRFLEVNHSAINHYGYSREEFLSMTLKDIRPHEDLPALMKDLEMVNDNIQTTTQWKHIKKNKEIIYVEVTALTFNYKGKKARHILINDITESKQRELGLIMLQEELKNFAANLQNVREEERMMLAREIHDDLAQTLIAVKIDMGIMKKKLSKEINNITVEGFINNFNSIFSMVDNTIHSSRKIMSGLKSEVLELLGFIETVKLYSKEFEERHNIKCVLNIKEDKVELEPLKSIALFRIYQEILTNVAQHSEATEVTVFLGIISNKLVFEVNDNGNGFDLNELPKPDAKGLISMKERVYVLEGKLTVDALPQKGTSVRVEMPYLKG